MAAKKVKKKIITCIAAIAVIAVVIFAVYMISNTTPSDP